MWLPIKRRSSRGPGGSSCENLSSSLSHSCSYPTLPPIASSWRTALAWSRAHFNLLRKPIMRLDIVLFRPYWRRLLVVGHLITPSISTFPGQLDSFASEGATREFLFSFPLPVPDCLSGWDKICWYPSRRSHPGTLPIPPRLPKVQSIAARSPCGKTAKNLTFPVPVPPSSDPRPLCCVTGLPANPTARP